MATGGLLAPAVPASGLFATRSLFFGLCAWAALRFIVNDWVTPFYVEPSYHFTWPGLAFVEPLPAPAMHGLFVGMAACALMSALGIGFRINAWLFATAFTYVELIDRTYYLNHHYLMSVVAFLFAAGPDVGKARLVPRGFVYLLRTQVGLVYVYAGLAKVGTDFLIRGEPLHTWLLHHAATPWLGPWLAMPKTALAMSWAGALFDLAIVPCLLIGKSRPWAYATVVLFHTTTGMLFDIGLFPWVMSALATVFFDPGWLEFSRARQQPDRAAPLQPATKGAPARPARSHARPGRRLFPWPRMLALGHLAAQLVLPLRHLTYPGATNWSEEGFRFAFRVMLIEKTGHVEYRLVSTEDGRTRTVSPREQLTPLQTRTMSTQPDMIAQFGRHLAAAEYRMTGHRYRVYADTRVSLNGRRPAPIIAPDCNLAAPWPTFAAAPCIVRALPPAPGDRLGNLDL